MKRFATLASVLVLALAASPAVADDPTHGPGTRAFEAFVVDSLPELVVGEEFDWEGRHYEVVGVGSITRTYVQRTRPRDVNDDVAAQGSVFAVIRVKVDGELKRARIEGNARYVTGLDGWEWAHVLLYLGLNDSYDFVDADLR